MNTEIQQSVDYIVARSQARPRLAPRDQITWDAFLSYLSPRYATIRYDVRLGDGVPPPPGASDVEQSMWTALTQYRIDVAILTSACVYLVEVKDQLNPAVLGQMLVYMDATKGTPLHTPDICWVVLCALSHQHTEDLLANHGVRTACLDHLHSLADCFPTLLSIEPPVSPI